MSNKVYIFTESQIKKIVSKTINEQQTTEMSSVKTSEGFNVKYPFIKTQEQLQSFLSNIQSNVSALGYDASIKQKLPTDVNSDDVLQDYGKQVVNSMELKAQLGFKKLLELAATTGSNGETLLRNYKLNVLCGYLNKRIAITPHDWCSYLQADTEFLPTAAKLIDKKIKDLGGNPQNPLQQI